MLRRSSGPARRGHFNLDQFPRVEWGFGEALQMHLGKEEPDGCLERDK